MSKIEEIDKKIEQLQNQKQAAIARDRNKKRNARTKRLIEKGALLEKYLGDISNEDVEKISVIGLMIHKANLLNADKEFLLGCFLGIKTIDIGGKNYLTFKENGRRFLINKGVES